MTMTDTARLTSQSISQGVTRRQTM